MNEIKPFAILKEGNRVGLLSFDVYKGHYSLLGYFDKFVERENVALFFSEKSSEFTIVFQNEEKILRGVKGIFVGVLDNKVFFENENKELMSVDCARNVVKEAASRIENYKFWKGKDKAFYVIKSLAYCPLEKCSLEADGWINLKSVSGFQSSHRLQKT